MEEGQKGKEIGRLSFQFKIEVIEQMFICRKTQQNISDQHL